MTAPDALLREALKRALQTVHDLAHHEGSATFMDCPQQWCIDSRAALAATPPASAETVPDETIVTIVRYYLDAGYDLDYIRDALEEATRE